MHADQQEIDIMSAAENQNVTNLDAQNLTAMIELQRKAFRAEGEVTSTKSFSL